MPNIISCHILERFKKIRKTFRQNRRLSSCGNAELSCSVTSPERTEMCQSRQTDQSRKDMACIKNRNEVSWSSAIREQKRFKITLRDVSRRNESNENRQHLLGNSEALGEKFLFYHQHHTRQIRALKPTQGVAFLSQSEQRKMQIFRLLHQEIHSLSYWVLCDLTNSD
jgi:hypothetical protein